MTLPQATVVFGDRCLGEVANCWVSVITTMSLPVTLSEVQAEEVRQCQLQIRISN
jgi:hypothetical protein